jgi:hypothetical protein
MKKEEGQKILDAHFETWDRGPKRTGELTRNVRMYDVEAHWLYEVAKTKGISEEQSVTVAHPIYGRDLEHKTMPPIRMTNINRQRVVNLLNNLSIKNVQEALALLFRSEAGMSAPDSIEIVVGQEVSKCNRVNRACTNGKTIWISLAMFEGDNAPTEREIGFKVPPSVKPGTIVVLHEFAHLLMGHPYNTVTSTEVKEKRADAWVQKFVEPLW